MHRWMLTNYIVNDFLLGVMVLCFAVHIHRSKDEQSRMIDVDTEKENLASLESSYKVLLNKSETCKDAHRVSYIVRTILDNTNTPPEAPSRSQLPTGVAQNIEPMQHEATGHQSEPGSALLEPFTFMNTPSGEFDWSLFDLEAFNQDTF